MNQIYSDILSDASNALDALSAIFDGFDFQAETGNTLDDLSDIDDLDWLINSADSLSLIPLCDFEDLIGDGLRSADGKSGVKHFDWEAMRDSYTHLEDKYSALMRFRNEIDDLGENIDTLNAETKEDIKDSLLDMMIDLELVKVLDHSELGEIYIYNSAAIKDKIKGIQS